MTDLAIVTRFGPGRAWEIPIWRDTLKRLGVTPAETRLIVSDNTGEADTRAELLRACDSQPWARWCLLTAPPVCANREDKKPENYAYRMARMQTQLAWACGDAPMTLLLDSDVLVPVAQALGGKPVVAHLIEHMADDVAVVATPIRARWANNDGVSVYRVKGDQFQPFGPRSRVEVQAGGVQEVHVSGTGCALWRTEIMQRYGFRPQANLHKDKKLGHEWYTYKRMLTDSWRVLCDWDIRPRHYVSETEYVEVTCAKDSA